MSLRKFLLLPLAAASLLRAQEPLNPPVPLASSSTAPSPGSTALTLIAAERAQELGFPSIAAGLYRELLAGPHQNTASLTLALATALIDDNRPEEAERTLSSWTGPRGATWHLRHGLAEAGLRRNDAARADLAAVKIDELPPVDRAWYFFLQGTLLGAAGDLVKAADFYQQAERAAATDLERARFLLAHEQARLRVGAITPEIADQTRLNAVRFHSTATGYDFARQYAVMLNALGRKSDAVAAIQAQLLTLPPQERARAGDFRLLLGLIAGAADGAGRNALIQLLETGSDDPDRQRAALQLLAVASTRGPARAPFRAELDKLISPSAPHPILEDLLLFRANWALGDKDYAQAEDDAHALLEKFPGSPLKPYALCVLTGSAWEQRRYRTAADDAFQARAASPPGEARAELGVVVAEAWFRAQDFRNAAEAYAAALHDLPSTVAPGVLMFQRIEAQIEARSLDDAQKALDDLARDPAFDIVDRWQAEWNLARALEVKGDTRAAYDRVNRLLAGPAQGLPPELRVRMAWLQARLSFDAGEPARTLTLVDSLTASLGGLPASFSDEIASTGALLRAQANFALNREADALAVLKKIRANYPKTDAAVYSYIIEADHYAEQDKIVDAQQLLTKLADDYPKSDYAPYALFQAALQAERLGQDKNLREGDKLIESLVTKYPNSPLVFDARLKQGDLLRKLNEFPRAQQVYESLRTNFSQNPDVIYAELDLAECDDAQSASDSPSDRSHAESAIALFADLRDNVDAPLDMRVEAGFSLGDLYKRRHDLAQAQDVWFRDVVSAFLLDPPRAQAIGAKGRYWMTRTLLELGELYEGQAKLDDARKAWELILTEKLPGAALAQAQLARFNSTAAKQ